MRFVYATIAFLCCCLSFSQELPLGGVPISSGGGGSAPVFVQGCGNSATTSVTVTCSSAVTAGDQLVVYVGGNGNTSTVSMTGETFTHLTGCSNNTGFEGDCFVDTNAVGGQTTLTCTQSAGASVNCGMVELTSPIGGHATDGTGNAQSVTTAVSVSTSVATTNAKDTCVGMAFTSVSGGITAGSGWTSRVPSPSQSLLMETMSPGSTGVQTATGTAPSGTTNMPEGIVCLKP